MTKLITSTMKLNHEKQWQKDNLEQKWIEHKGTITENDWKPKVSDDTVTIGENNSRMFNRQITCCARLKVKWGKHSKQKAFENAAKL